MWQLGLNRKCSSKLPWRPKNKEEPTEPRSLLPARRKATGCSRAMLISLEGEVARVLGSVSWWGWGAVVETEKLISMVHLFAQ